MRLIDADNLDEYLSVYNGKLAVGPWNGAIKHIQEYAPTVDAIPISFILEEEQKIRTRNMERDIPLTTPIIKANTLEALIEAWRNRNDS